MEGRRRVLGGSHRDTFWSIDSMGVILQSEGRLPEAEAMFLEALDARRRVLGIDDPDTLMSINNLGYVLILEDRLDEAERYCSQAAASSHRVHGENHPDTLTIKDSLAQVYVAQGRLLEADRLLVQTLKRARGLPGSRLLLGSILSSHGRCLTLLKRYTGAEAALLEAHAMLVTMDEPEARRAERNLLALYQAWGKPDKAAAWLVSGASGGASEKSP